MYHLLTLSHCHGYYLAMSNKSSTFAGWEGWYALKRDRTQHKKENPLQDYRRGDYYKGPMASDLNLRI